MKWAHVVNVCQELAAYLKHRTEEGRKTAEEAAVRPAGNSHGRTLILAPRACREHRTAPEPLTRDAWGHMPPENVCRLHVLTDPGSRQADLSPLIDCFWNITNLVLHAMTAGCARVFYLLLWKRFVEDIAQRKQQLSF